MRKLGLTLVAAVAAATAFGVSSARAADEVVVATAGPMTGQYASFGEQMKRGAQLAIDDINAKGGGLGHKRRLEIGRDLDRIAATASGPCDRRMV